MVTIEQPRAASQSVFRAMGERKLCQALAQCAEQGLVRDAAQSQVRARLGLLYCRRQELAAGVDLHRQRFVLGWHAAHRIRDQGPLEPQAVVRAL
jgi:hypothetical protein